MQYKTIQPGPQIISGSTVIPAHKILALATATPIHDQACGADPWATAEEYATDNDLDSACNCLHIYADSFYAESDIHEKTNVLWLMGISLICESLNVLFIGMFEGLRQHPMPVINWLAIANFSFLWSSLSGGYICEWN